MWVRSIRRRAHEVRCALLPLEIAFLVPWSVVLADISGEAFAAMALFLFILVIGFIYEWKKGALEWE